MAWNGTANFDEQILVNAEEWSLLQASLVQAHREIDRLRARERSLESELALTTLAVANATRPAMRFATSGSSA